jgi:adenine deaminase
MDDVVRRAIEEGIAPVEAIQMATLNTAEHFGTAGDVGSIGPGRYADILIVSDLRELTIDTVLAAGDVVAEQGALRLSTKSFAYPPAATASIHLAKRPTESSFRIASQEWGDEATCRVIEIVEGQVLTRCAHATVPVVRGALEPPPASGISRLCVVERHTGSGRIGQGLVKGYGLTEPFGLASSVAHDCHNLLVMGSDAERMAEAAGCVTEHAGGICLVGRSGRLCEIALPIAGLMTTEPVDVVARRMDELRQAFVDLGCAVEDALMSFLFLALPVIPALRLTDRGLVDVDAFQIVPLTVSPDNPKHEEER